MIFDSLILFAVINDQFIGTDEHSEDFLDDYKLDARSISLDEDNRTLRLTVFFILSIFEFIVWILVFIIYQKLREEAKQKRIEKHHRRKLNTVAEQLTILQPAYSELPVEGKDETKENKSEDSVIIVDENFAEEVPFEKIERKKTPEEIRNLKKFIQNEQEVAEKSNQKVQTERKILDVKELKTENLPPPPKGF